MGRKKINRGAGKGVLWRDPRAAQIHAVTAARLSDAADDLQFDLSRFHGYTKKEAHEICMHFFGHLSVFSDMQWPECRRDRALIPLYIEILKIAAVTPPDDFMTRMRAGAFDPENQL